MQRRFRERIGAVGSPREALLASILARSILDRSSKTFHDEAAEQFVIADLKPTRPELERWRDLAG